MVKESADKPPRRQDAKMKNAKVAGFLRMILPWRLCVLAVQFGFLNDVVRKTTC
jgi:hypothetical protein